MKKVRWKRNLKKPRKMKMNGEEAGKMKQERRFDDDDDYDSNDW